MAERKHRVLVLNHFAARPGQAGGTRHTELFGRLGTWEHLIIAGDRNYLTGERVSSGEGFLTVPVTSHSTNSWQRILNWVSYSWHALFAGLRQGKVDVVYASSPHLFAALTGWIIASVKRVPLVLEVRDLWPKVLVDMGQLSQKSMIYRVLARLEHFLYSRAAVIVILAEGSRSELESRGIPGGKIVYIPNGADPLDFTPSEPRDELRQRFGFTRFTAIYAGAHGPANGLDLLLDAAEATQDLDVDVVLVGGGLLKEQLVNDARRRGLGNVRFMEPVSKAEIPDLLAAADLGLHVLADVQLFRTAVSPNKVFDYMASGLPVLTNCPGLVADLVSASGAGFAVEPTELAAGMRAIAVGGCDGDLAKCGDAGQRWITIHQSRTAMAARLAAVLGSVKRDER